MGNLFGTTQTTNNQQNSQQSGSSTNPLAGTILDYSKNSVLPMFSASNINSIAPNQWMTGAAQNQAGVGSNLFPAFNAASNIAQNGVQASDISRFMNPYTQNVIDAYNRQADFNDARTLGQAQGAGALRGSLTNSASKANQDYMRSVMAANRDMTAANLYNTGYGSAVSNAFQNNAGILGAAQGLGSLAGAATGVNTGLGNLGQGIFQAGLAPYSLTTQGAQALSGMAPATGTSYSGTSSGTSTGSSQNNPGLIPSILGIAGLGMTGYNYGQQKGWWGAANGGRIEAMPRYNSGGVVDRLSETFHGLRGMLSGGSVMPKYDAGGWVPVVEREPQGPTPEAMLVGRLNDVMKSFQPTTGMDAIAKSQDTLSRFMAANQPQQAMPRYADGGSTIQPLSPEGQLAATLLAGSPLSNMSSTMLNMQQQRMQEEQNKRQFGLDVGRTMGNYNNSPTLGMLEFREKQYQNDLPQIRPVDVNPDTGQPVYAWTSPQQSPLFRPRNETAPPVVRQNNTMAPVVPVPSAVPGQTVAQPGIAPITAPNGLNASNAESVDLTGEDFAKWLESRGRKPYADKLRAIAEGRERFPENPRTPIERQLQTDAMKYDPSLDGTTYQVRSSTLKDFNAGPTSKNIAALNTAARHAADLYAAIDNLGTSDRWGGEAARKLFLPIYRQDPTWKPKLNTFEAKKLALSEEAAKAFHGGPTVSGVEEWKKTLDVADSPSALRASAAALIKLLEGRVQEVEGNYFRAMGKYPARPVLSPKAKEEYELIKKAAAENLTLEEARKRMAQSEPGAVNGPAAGPRVDKPAQDRLPPSNEAPTKKFRNKQTGEEILHRLVDGKWVPAQ